jgi:hypothetical protein
MNSRAAAISVATWVDDVAPNTHTVDRAIGKGKQVGWSGSTDATTRTAATLSAPDRTSAETLIVAATAYAANTCGATEVYQV